MYRNKYSTLWFVKAVLLMAWMILLFVSVSATADNKPREWRLVSTIKLATLEKELNEAAQHGFRLEQLSQGLASFKAAAIMSRDPAAPTQPGWEYKVLDGKQLKDKCAELAAQGFEFRGVTSVFRLLVLSPATVFERQVGKTSSSFEYEMIFSEKEKILQAQLDQAVSAGFLPIGLLGESAFARIVLRRSRENPAAEMGTFEYKLIDTARASTLEKEMNAAAAEGWRFEMASLGLTVLMSRPIKPPRQARYEYTILSTQRTKTLEKEIIEQAHLGYLFRASSIGFGLAAIMEREKNAGPPQATPEYKLLAEKSAEKMQQQLNDACAAGWKWHNLIVTVEFMIVLERRAMRPTEK
jgi:hypothetical protein